MIERSFWLLFVCLLSRSCSYVIDKSYTLDKPYADLLEGSFGMAFGGEIHLSYDISHLDNSTYVLFIVVNENMQKGWYDNAPTGSLNADDAIKYCNSPSINRLVATNRGEFSYVAARTDRYYVHMFQCSYPQSPDGTVKIGVTLEMFNPVPRGTGRNYLSIDDTPLLVVIPIEITFSAILMIGWIFYYVKRRISIKPVHYIFLAALIFDIIGLSIEHYAFRLSRDHGTNEKQYLFASSIFKVFRNTSFVTSTLALALGWCINRLNLTPNEEKFVATTCSLFLCFALIGENCLYQGRNDGFCRSIDVFQFLVRGVIVIASLLAMNYTIAHMRNGLLTSPWSPTVPINYLLLHKVTKFRIVYLGIIIFPTVFVIIELTMLSWKSSWLNRVFSEGFRLFVYWCYGTIFAPYEVASLLRAFDGSMRDLID